MVGEGFGVSGFDFCWCLIALRFVQPGGVPPVDSVHGRELDIGQAVPGRLGVDQLGLVQAIDGFGKGIVVAIADRSD